MSLWSVGVDLRIPDLIGKSLHEFSLVLGLPVSTQEDSGAGEATFVLSGGGAVTVTFCRDRAHAFVLTAPGPAVAPEALAAWAGVPTLAMTLEEESPAHRVWTSEEGPLARLVVLRVEAGWQRLEATSAAPCRR